ncbi:AAA-like domain-containing protein [Lyngbya aestuarii]|uniref:AAA-like domain-containing protein n=1 Tax=Lyngbya aestuarii TaxID=118322 RepID=UPI00403DBFD9
MSSEFPGGPVPLNSAFYINRPPIEELACATIDRPGSVIRIKAPRKMGKSSLLLRVTAHAAVLGHQIVSLDMNQAEEAVFASLDKFLRWFCINVGWQLKLEANLDDYWDEDIGSKISCTIYLQEYILKQIKSPLVLVLNEVNQVFEHPPIAKEFLSLLRSWHEEAQYSEILGKLRLVVVHSTEVYIPLQINQSPFNVGLPIRLPEFSLAQVQDLALRNGLHWTDGKDAKQLMSMVGGHPYLVSLAVYHLRREGITLEQVSQKASTPAGIYGSYLRHHLAMLRQHPELSQAMQQLVTIPKGVCLEAITAYKLESMGLVKLDGNEVRLSCNLYRLFFKEQLLEEFSLSNSGLVSLGAIQPQPVQQTAIKERLIQLERENQELKRLFALDELTELANRRCFEQQLAEQWQFLARQMKPLSMILCDIDFFKYYNDTYGHQAGDACLRAIANALSEITRHWSEITTCVPLIARYNSQGFAVLLPYINLEDAVQLAKEICIRVKDLEIAHESLLIDGLPASVVTVSLGVASTIPKCQDSPTTIVDAAEQALDQSQKKGHDCVSFSKL